MLVAVFVLSQILAAAIYFAERRRSMQADREWRDIVKVLSNKACARTIDAYQVLQDTDFPDRNQSNGAARPRVEDLDMAQRLSGGL